MGRGPRGKKRGGGGEGIDLPLLFAKLARFYGWTHRQILSLRLRHFKIYSRQIGRLEAAETIMANMVQSLPWMKKGDRAAVLRDLNRQLEGSLINERSHRDLWNNFKKRMTKGGNRF